MTQPYLVANQLGIRGGHVVGDHRLRRRAEVVSVDMGTAASDAVKSRLLVASNHGGETERSCSCESAISLAPRIPGHARGTP